MVDEIPYLMNDVVMTGSTQFMDHFSGIYYKRSKKKAKHKK